MAACQLLSCVKSISILYFLPSSTLKAVFEISVLQFSNFVTDTPFTSNSKEPAAPYLNNISSVLDGVNSVSNFAENPSSCTPGANALFPSVANSCLLYTSDAADEEDSVDLGGRR